MRTCVTERVGRKLNFKKAKLMICICLLLLLKGLWASVPIRMPTRKQLPNSCCVRSTETSRWQSSDRRRSRPPLKSLCLDGLITLMDPQVIVVRNCLRVNLKLQILSVVLASGIIAGVGKGFLRVVHSKPELVGDMIPVEFPIHLMIAVAWYTATHK